jgi:hypothetical protein
MKLRGMSRGRTINRFYAVAGMPEREEFAPADGRHDPIADITAALARSRAKLMASDVGGVEAAPTEALRREVNDLRRDGAGRIQAVLRELRRVRIAIGESRDQSDTGDRFAGSRHAALVEAAQGLEAQLDAAGLGAFATVTLIEDELARRVSRRMTARRLLAPPAMLEAIGPRPERPLELQRWCREVATFDSEPLVRRTVRRSLGRN